MRKKKIIYTLSALMMACIIAFSGVGGSYIQAEASSGVFDVLWNDDATIAENIGRHLLLWGNVAGVAVSPNLITGGYLMLNIAEFYSFMLSDGYTTEQAHDVLCDCGDSTHTSFTGNEHGGGGFIRDGVSVDSDGNVTYSDEVSDLFHDYICNYLETECGYWVVETLAADELNAAWFNNETLRLNTAQTIKNFGIAYVAIKSIKEAEPEYINFYYVSSSDFVLMYGETTYLPSKAISCIRLDSVNGYVENTLPIGYIDSSMNSNCLSKLKTSALSETNFYKFSGSNTGFVFKVDQGSSHTLRRFIATSDGRLVKVFRSSDDFLNYNMKQQPYYVLQNWVNYDASVDNSVTITNKEYQYYTDNSTIIYQTIQNNIDNSGSDLTEEDIQKIVEDAVKEIKDSIPDNSGSGDSGSGDSDDGNGSTSDNDTGSGGTGVGDLIDGIGKIFDTILSLIGKLMGVVADFTQSILDLFSGFTTFTDGFSDFLAGAFSFIPPEVWDIVKVGLSLMVLLAVIKFLRK